MSMVYVYGVCVCLRESESVSVCIYVYVCVYVYVYVCVGLFVICISNLQRGNPNLSQVVRMREKRREKAAQKFIIDQMKLGSESKVKVTSSWGPYTTTDGTAEKTKVPGA